MERERLKREVELQRQRLQELVQQQVKQRPAWQTMLLPALGAGFFALLLGWWPYTLYIHAPPIVQHISALSYVGVGTMCCCALQIAP